MKSLKYIILTIGVLFSLNSFAADHLVEIQGFRFIPAQLTVAEGDTIVFINKDGAPHNVKPRDTSEQQFETSPILNTNDSFELVVGQGELLIHCGVHPRMPGIDIEVVSKVVLLIEDIQLKFDELKEALNE